MNSENELLHTLQENLKQQTFVSATFSSPLKSNLVLKATARPLQIKHENRIQTTEFRNQQAFHKNLSHQEFLDWFQAHATIFKQILIQFKHETIQILRSKNDQVTYQIKKRASPSLPLKHNRKKNYLLEEGFPVPFLVELGIMDPKGNVNRSKADKFRQINKFLEIVNESLVALDPLKTIRILDFGCGKSYLSFALYHFLKFTKNKNVQITGLDLKEDVIQICNELSKKLGYEQDLVFTCGNINDFKEQSIDLMVSLHACDVATDAALEKAVKCNAKVILAVPCCQHELYHQIKQPLLDPLLRHGILKERFAALVTDAARAELLESLGYHTQIIEFIDFEHTPKNLLIRAIKKVKQEIPSTISQAYHEFADFLHVTPSFEKKSRSCHSISES